MFANFQGQNLHRANFKEASLRAANLQETNLFLADLREADLRNASFSGADLCYADISNAILPDVNQLAGMDLTGTRLPSDIAKFEGLANVKEAATKASHLFTILLLGCLYAWLTVGTGFMGEAKEDKLGLPFIYNAYISREGFSLAAPLFLLGLYGYLHIYLQRLWEHLALLPAIFPDGTTLDKKATPWLFVGYVRAHMPKLRALPPQPMDRLQTCLIQLAAYWLVPITLGMFWWDSLGQGSRQGTAIDGLLTLAALGLGYWFMSLAAGTLSGRIGPRQAGQESPRRGLRQALADNMVEVAWFLLGVVPMFAGLTYFNWPG
ncbi:MAG: pentapeptide repeat-containing protein [Desulfarculus sp.]|nr:pentapeptide repeat-containing protein [Desulfarculus sp.]